MSCMILCRTFDTASEHGQGKKDSIPIPGPETVSGSAF